MGGDDDWLDDDAPESDSDSGESYNEDFEERLDDEDGIEGEDFEQEEEKKKFAAKPRPKMLQVEGKVVTKKDDKGNLTHLIIDAGKQKYSVVVDNMAKELSRYSGQYLLVTILETPADEILETSLTYHIKSYI